MTINTISNEWLYKELERRFFININGKEIVINKWIKLDEIAQDYDSDWKFNTIDDKEVFESLDNNEQDLFTDYIGELEM